MKNKGVEIFIPIELERERSEKSDFALFNIEILEYCFFQMKGLSINNCSFDGKESVVGVETQLTRGRVNDHPTQSRLYLFTDFDSLIIAIDPPVAALYRKEVGLKPKLEWEFYVIPSGELNCHHKMNHRIKSLQKIGYIELQKYRIKEGWIKTWG